MGVKMKIKVKTADPEEGEQVKIEKLDNGKLHNTGGRSIPF